MPLQLTDEIIRERIGAVLTAPQGKKLHVPDKGGSKPLCYTTRQSGGDWVKHTIEAYPPGWFGWCEKCLECLTETDD